MAKKKSKKKSKPLRRLAKPAVSIAGNLPELASKSPAPVPWAVVKRPRMYPCGKCGRLIWGEKSVREGMGPACARKQNPQAKLEAQGQMRMPGL